MGATSTAVARRQRLLFGGRPTGWSLLVPVTFFLAGLLFALSASASHGYDLRRSGTEGLADLVRSRSYRLAEQQAQVTRLSDDVAALQAAARPGDTTLAPLTKAVDAASIPAGLTAVEGPGLKVTLDDSDKPLSSFNGEYTADDLVIHQQDVQAFVNALWRGGAEAMMIQDQRVVSTSAVRCVGNTLILQGRVYSPPFTIRAIGDVARMRAAVDADENVAIFQQYVQAVGVRLDVADLGTTRFPAYDGSVALQHAKVAR